jgi:starch-binding outer membrane protein, SusD/RagB family
MMKKYIIIAGVIALFSSCKKTELELFPYNQIETEQAFSTENDANLALNGMYFGLRASGSYYQGTWSIFGEVTADNVIISQLGRLSQQASYNWQYTADNTYALFAGGYTIARRANAIILNVDKLATTGSSATFINNMKAQALACRAMIYFDMSRIHAKALVNATSADSTIPYITSLDQSILPSKESVASFYGKVIADLNLANTLITTASAGNGVGRFSKLAVNGLLSRVYLYAGDWPNCIATSIAALPATTTLPSIAAFPAVWTDVNPSATTGANGSDGVLFKITNTLVDNINTLGVNYYQAVGSPPAIRSEYVVDFAFRQLFLPSDVRTNTYIQTSPFPSTGANQNHVIKFAGKPGFPAGVVDAKVLRTAEVLLNRAEAYYRNGNIPLALADLNLLKANRITGYVNSTTLTGQALLDEILLQRRLELAFEGDRFWDLKRRNEPVQRSSFGDKADGTGAPAVFTNLPAGNYRFNIPIPQLELNFNTNLKQVPGY